jgi:type I restriction enzyme S subunit
MIDIPLFGHFATLATAPDGIARLRELILQLAVQGKLGTQDAGDEPASVLLERIKKEKERFVKEGKIPKEKAIEYDNENTLDKSLPEHWILVRLGEISDKIHYGYTASADQTNRRIRLVRITDIQNDRVNWDLVPGCEIDDSNFLLYSINVGDLLIARTGGTVGKSFLVREQPVPAVFASYLIRVVPNKNLNSEYVKLFADSPIYWKQLYRMCMGTGQPNVNGMSLRSLFVPLPPLAEQHRIVAKVDRLMALCDELEAKQQQERAGCLKLGIASLTRLQNAESPEEFGRQWAQVCDAFDLILDCPENVAVLRQTILQLAVQGRLGTNNPKDMPFENLVKYDKTEKFDDTTPSVPLPKNWIYTPIASISMKVVDGVHKTPTYRNRGVPFLTVRNLTKGKFIDFTDVKYISEEEHQEFIKRTKPEKNDILITKDGTIGVTKKVREDIEFSIFVTLALIKPVEPAISDYLELALSSPQVQAKMARVGAGLQHLVIRDLNRLYIPLPPLAEQHRIVEKVNALMALCDELEARLKERAGVQGRFTAAVGKQVVNG